MRIQILNLPHVVLGEVVTEPFALIVDQYDGPTDADTVALWAKFREQCGAQAIGFHPGTVEVVDRYAEPADAGFADREIARLQDYLTTQFPLPKGVPGPEETPVDVAIRLISSELMRKKVAALKERMDRADSGQISWSPHIEGTTVTNSGTEPEAQCIGQDRCAGVNCPAHRDMP